jgi:hypothetical protein
LKVSKGGAARSRIPGQARKPRCGIFPQETLLQFKRMQGY